MNDAENGRTVEGAVSGATGITVRVFGRTDVGLVRDHNEDNFLIADLTAGNRSIKPEVRTHEVGEIGTLLVVCDGMGGAAAGEVASRIGADTIHEMMQQGRPPSDAGQIARWLEDAIREAGTRIYTAARLNRGQRGMGTTVTAAILASDRLVLGQVGDSRAYIVRQGRMVQVTKDQSLVQQLIDAKQLTEEEARNFERSNIILQALGTAEEVHVDVTSVLLRRGDALVMCSDGLSGPVEDDEILRVVTEHDDPLEACRLLTEKACEGGGDDNITVIVARFEGEGLEPVRDEDDLHYEKYDFPRVTETTVRTQMPKAPVVREATEDAESGVEEGGEAARAPAKQDDPQEGKAVAAAAPAAAAAAPRPEKERGRDPDKGRAGPVLGVLAVLAVVGVAAAWMGGVFGPGDAVQPAAPIDAPPAAPIDAPPAAPPAPLPAPQPSPPPPLPVRPSPAPAAEQPLTDDPRPEDTVTTTEPAPPLAPVDPADIAGEPVAPPAVEKAPESEVAAAGERPPKKSGSEPEAGASEKKAGKKAEKKKAEGPEKSAASPIDDNPF